MLRDSLSLPRHIARQGVRLVALDHPTCLESVMEIEGSPVHTDIPFENTLAVPAHPVFHLVHLLPLTRISKSLGQLLGQLPFMLRTKEPSLPVKGELNIGYPCSLA
jgi:hypothetical protein